MATVSEFIIDVNMSADHVWSAKVNAKVFSEASEEALRESVRVYLIGLVSADKDIPEGALKAKLKRTWRVRVVEEAVVPSSSDDDDTNAYDTNAGTGLKPKEYEIVENMLDRFDDSQDPSG